MTQENRTYRPFKPTDRDYKVFICSGKGKNRRERGAYGQYVSSYLEAATEFAKHWNVCTVSTTYGTKWRITHRAKKGYPKSHCYLKDELGNKLLVIRS